MSDYHQGFTESTPIMVPRKATDESSELSDGHDSSNKGQKVCVDVFTKNLKNGDENINRPIQSQCVDVEDTKEFKFSKIESRKKIVMSLCALANFLASSGYAILGPFFPLEGKDKGMDLTMIGFVFGVYQLVIFLASPLMGSFMTRAGVKFMFLSGIFVGGCSTILFGVLDKVPSGAMFLVMCLLVRTVEALGFAAFMTSSMTIVTCEFRDYAASVLAILKFANGAGNLFGPLLGGFLYGVGGYGLPFYCLGACILLNGLVIFKFLPMLHAEKESRKHKMTIIDMMHSPLVVVSLFSVFMGICGAAIYLTTFASHIKEYFDLTSPVIGALYTVGPVFYVVSAPVMAYITDVQDRPSLLIVISYLAGCVGWVLSGPCTFLPFIPFNLWTLSIGFSFAGIACCGLTIPPMKCIVQGIHDLKYERDPDTLAVVSGVYNSTFALGGFVGPLLGGILIQRYGFPYVFSGFAIGYLVLFLFTSCFFSFPHLMRRTVQEL